MQGAKCLNIWFISGYAENMQKKTRKLEVCLPCVTYCLIVRYEKTRGGGYFCGIKEPKKFNENVVFCNEICIFADENCRKKMFHRVAMVRYWV